MCKGMYQSVNYKLKHCLFQSLLGGPDRVFYEIHTVCVCACVCATHETNMFHIIFHGFFTLQYLEHCKGLTSSLYSAKQWSLNECNLKTAAIDMQRGGHEAT